MYTQRLSVAYALAYSALVLANGDNCIILKGDDKYSWKADGSFSGNGNIDGQQHCFGAGSGGISFGAPGATPGASGNTRLECHFAENPTAADFDNCNLSLVDGFSAAVTCETASGGWPNSNNASAPLGCGYDLMKNCPDSLKDDGCKCCKNTQGAHVSDVNSVDPAFHACDNSDKYPNTAELYFDMKGAYMFKKEDFPITCKVGQGSSPPSSKARRESGAVEAHQHAAAHNQKRSPLHARHVRARGLMDMIS